MTKELVKSENGHKIIKRARHDGTHSLLSSPRIKMGFAAPCLVILFLAVTAAGDTTTSTSSVNPVTQQNVANPTTDNGGLNPSESTVKTAVGKKMQPKNSGKNDDNDVAPDTDVTMDELLLLQSLIDSADELDESSQMNPDIIANRQNIKPGDINSDSNNPIVSKATPESDGIRRQGDLNSELKQEKPGPDIKFDDSKQEITNDPTPRFGQRSRNLRKNELEGAPLLELTQGGYDRPYRQPRYRNRYVSRPDSSEQTERVIQEPRRGSNRQQAAQGIGLQEPSRGSSRQQATQGIVPQVTYTVPQQPPYNSYGPILHPAFEAPARNVLAINHNVPTMSQNGFLNSPASGFADYTTTPFQAQFPSSDAGVFQNFGGDPRNALYQAPQGNPYQDPRLLFQGGSQGQSQPILIDTARNIPQQFQPDTFSAFTNFENIDENARPNYASYFRSPTGNPQFQVPPNFYETNQNGPQTFNNPPISFLSNPPNQDEGFRTQLFRYPVVSDPQNQRNINDQQPESDASQEDKKTNVYPQENARPANNDRPPSIPFGTRLSDQNEADVFIRYPTNVAGYAVEENLPPKNSSEEAKTSRESAMSEERNVPNADPYRNALNSLRPNQRRNISYEFPPQFFRDAPIDFGYQRPQNQILVQQPDRNRGLPRFPSPDFRSPFDSTFQPENNYLLLNANNQRRRNQESNKTPACAKQNNASICFEDNEYPRNDILYALNSNSFLADRLSEPELPLDAIAFVEQNASRSDQASTEKYACSVDMKYGSPVRAKNLAGAWRIIVSIPAKFSQPVRLEVCKSLGDNCSYADSKIKTSCVQKYSLQRLLTWSPNRGIYFDIYKLPIACSCQILEKV